jgi:thioesterase domain-containing protein
MQIAAGDVGENFLSLQAPLEPNINDKLTAFGGSLSSLATLTGWVMTAVLAQRYPQSCDIVVTQTKTDFLLPVKDKIISTRLQIPNAQIRKDFGLHLSNKGRAKLVCEVEIITEKGLALLLLGTYLARINTEQKSP